MQAIRRGIDRVVPLIAAFLFLIGVGSTVLGAVVRTTSLTLPVAWVEEVTRYCLIWGALLLMGIGFRKKTQTQFTLLEERLRGKGKAGYTVIILLITAVMFGILVVGGFQLAEINAAQRTPVLMMSMSIPYLSIPISSLLVELELVMLIIEEIRVLTGKTPPQDSTQEVQ